MLNLAAKQEALRADSKPFADLVPWVIEIAPGYVLCKDGSLLAVLSLAGLDLEGADEVQYAATAELLEHSIKVLHERASLHWLVDRVRTDVYPEGAFAHPISRLMDAEYARHFTSERQYRNEHHLAILLSPAGGSENFFDRISALMNKRGLSAGQALREVIKTRFSGAGVFDLQAEEIGAMLKTMDTMIAQFQKINSELGLDVLKGGALQTLLHARVAPNNRDQTVAIAPDAYLDTALCDSALDVGDDVLRLSNGDTTTYAAVLSLKSWADSTFPGMLDELLAIDGEIVVSQVLRLIERDKATAYIRKVRTHQQGLQKSFVGYIKEAVAQEEADASNPQHVVGEQQADEALASTAEGAVFGYFNMTVLALGATATEARTVAERATNAIQAKGYLVYRESMHALSAFAGTLTGQWAEPLRWHFVSQANAADLAMVRTLDPGDDRNAYLSEQAGRPLPALAAFHTPQRTPYLFNFHTGDLGHALVLGPTRSGKSVFDNFVISQYLKYHPRIYIFDKDESCMISTLLQGGSHIGLGSEGDTVKLNPLSLLSERDNWPWIAQWLEGLVAAQGYQIRAEDSKALWEAIQGVAAMDSDKWRLINLQQIIPSTKLAAQLNIWVGGGRWARFFDHNEDSLELGTFTCLEMGGLWQEPTPAGAAIEYLFKRIFDSLDGTPTLIYLEEAWFFLGQPRFAERINDWLRTLAKRNAILVMATQSIIEIARSEFFHVIIDSIPTRIFLPNRAAGTQSDVYQRTFDLNPAQIAAIRSAVPKKNYYLTTPRTSRLLEASFPPRVLACLRSDTRAKAVFHKHYARGGEDWQLRYIEEMTNEETT
jgi:type IV secretion system protein VirB4